MKQEIYELTDLVKKHDLLYDKAEPIITDTEYDRLYNKLVRLEKEYPQFKREDSPTSRIYSMLVDSLKKVNHTEPLLSLSKVNDKESIENFLNKFDDKTLISVGLKEDGLTIKLVYDNHVLVEASTRGDGRVGEDVTHSIRLLNSVPNYIEYGDRLEVRGEAIITFKEFERINTEGQYKSPRNLVSGSVRTLESIKASERGVQVNIFDLLNSKDIGHITDVESKEFLREQGFTLTDMKTFLNDEKGKQELVEYCLSFSDKERDNVGHMVDGLVLKVSDYEKRKELGVTSKYPRWAVAFKFDSLDATTTITGVDWSIGKTGQVTPNAILEPVEIDGVTIGKASLANFANIEKRDIRVNDVVVVARANDVIPQVVSPVKEQRIGNEIKIETPEQCPSCGAELFQELGKDSEGNEAYTLYCKNPQCEAQLIRILENFVSRNCLDIDGLGAETVTTLYRKGLVNKIESIYELKDKKDEILKLDRFGERKVNKLLAGIEESKKQPLENFLKGLGIRNIGNNVSEILTDKHKNWTELKTAIETGELEEYLSNVKGIGEILKQSVLNAFQDEHTIETLDELQRLGCLLEQPMEQDETTTSLEGNTFVITGKLSRPRKDIQKDIENAGGKVTGSVTGNTTYLVLGGYNDETGEFEGAMSSKHKKANEQGVTIISEDKLKEMLL